MKYSKTNKIKLIILFIFFFHGNAISQIKKIEIQYGISGWYDKNQRELPEIEDKIFLNNNLMLGYNIFPHFSMGLSTNYYYDKYHSKGKYIILPDRILFEEWTIKHKQLGFGPYLKFSIGKSYRLSLIIDYNYAYGVSPHNSFVEHSVELTEYSSSEVNYITEYTTLNISIGKRISEHLILDILFKEQYTFNYRNIPETTMIFIPCYNQYFGIQFNYSFNLKNN